MQDTVINVYYKRFVDNEIEGPVSVNFNDSSREKDNLYRTDPRPPLRFSSYDALYTTKFTEVLYSLQDTIQGVKDLYLVGPLYNANDFQFCVSGTYETRDNNIYTTLRREVAEEVGLQIRNDNDKIGRQKLVNSGLIQYDTVENRGFNTLIATVHCGASEVVDDVFDANMLEIKVRNVNNVEHQRVIPVSDGNGFRKSVAFITGTLNCFGNYYNGRPTPVLRNDDQIYGLVLIKVEDVKKYMSYVNFRNQEVRQEVERVIEQDWKSAGERSFLQRNNEKIQQNNERLNKEEIQRLLTECKNRDHFTHVNGNVKLTRKGKFWVDENMRKYEMKTEGSFVNFYYEGRRKYTLQSNCKIKDYKDHRK